MKVPTIYSLNYVYTRPDGSSFPDTAVITTMGMAFCSQITVMYCNGENINTLTMTGGHFANIALVIALADSPIKVESKEFMKDDEAEALIQKFLDSLPEPVKYYIISNKIM